jgi:hypothetical protein
VKEIDNAGPIRLTGAARCSGSQEIQGRRLFERPACADAHRQVSRCVRQAHEQQLVTMLLFSGAFIDPQRCLPAD